MGTSKSTGRSERVERAVEGVMAAGGYQKVQGHEHLCHTGMPVRNGNLGTD